MDYNTIIDGMILQRRFSEFLQELSMHSVYQALFPLPPQEPGNEANVSEETYED